MKKAIFVLCFLLLILASGCGRGPGSDPVSPNSSSMISEEQAKKLALNQAGVTSDGVRFDRVELDRDNGVWHYEIEFSKGRIEYDVDVKAEDGSILSFEMDD